MAIQLLVHELSGETATWSHDSSVAIAGISDMVFGSHSELFCCILVHDIEDELYCTVCNKNDEVM